MKKFEVKRNPHPILRQIFYGVWNNDMQAFQYLEPYNSNRTNNIDIANLECKRLNKIYEKSINAPKA